MDQKKILLSLVVCTYKRDKELVRVLRSLGEIPRTVEIVVVDQNPEPLELGDERKKVEKVIRKKIGSLSEGRKEGIRLARGMFVGIPDDDNYYKEGFLETLIGTLERYQADELMVGAIANWKVFKKFPGSRKLGSWETLTYGNSGTIFIRRSVLESMRDYGLAMDMSPGSEFPAGDETMLIANVLSRKKCNYFVGVEHAYIDHPVFPISKERECIYGVGMGGLAAKLMMKKWAPGWRLAIRMMVGAPMELIFYIAIGRRERGRVAYVKMIKRWEGFWKMTAKAMRTSR